MLGFIKDGSDNTTMIVEGLSLGLGVVLLLGWVGLELPHRRRPGNALEVIPGEWNLEVYEPQHYRLIGELGLRNPAERLEVMVPELTAEVTLLSKASLEGITHKVGVQPRHPDVPARPDGFWFAYVLKSHKQTTVEICIDIYGSDLSDLQAAWIQVPFITYGPKGRVTRVHHEVVPLGFPSPELSTRWRSVSQGEVLPIRTHLLTQLDDPVEIVRRYVAPHAQPGDIVSIGETPIAIMQGRWHHPTSVKPGWLARRLCYFFLPTSSLASACGLQTLVDIVGPTRVLFAFIGGAIAKVFGRPGVFYQLAGEQARLIDDVTGTLPPYDQFIVLGPDEPQQVVDRIRAETGLEAAIVDVNDLKAVAILAATANANHQLLNAALRNNPAGNADEQTPVVLIRPTEATTSAS